MEEIFKKLTQQGKKRSTELKIYSSHQKLKINTGADITVISYKTYKNLRNRLSLRPTERRFRRIGGTLSSKGKFWTSTTQKKKLHIRDQCTKWSEHRKFAVQKGYQFNENNY